MHLAHDDADHVAVGHVLTQGGSFTSNVILTKTLTTTATTVP
jgi:hypothetical protein